MESSVSNYECLKIVQTIFKFHNQRVEIEEKTFKALSESTIGFLGDHSLLKIRVKLLKNGELTVPIYKDVHLFVKTKPKGEDQARYVNEIGAFTKETVAFSELFPILQKNSTVTWSPKCYLAKPDLIVFEDLTKKGYKMFSSKVGFDVNHMSKAIETLAGFHSASMVYENSLPENGKYNIKDLFYDCLFESVYVTTKGHVRQLWLASGVKLMTYIARMTGKYSEEEMEKVEKLLPSFVERVCDDVKPAEDTVNVVCHGDLWCNNFMFKYNSEGDLLNCILVDFQLIRYASPFLDLACLIFLNSSRETRKVNFERFVKAYCDALNSELDCANLEESRVTYDDCLKYVKYYSAAAIFECYMFALTIYIPNDIVTKILNSSEEGSGSFFHGDKTSLVREAFLNDVFFRNIISSIVDELILEHILVK